MKLSRLAQIDRVVKVLALASDPRRERPGEATSAATLAESMLRSYGMVVIVPRGTPIRLIRIRDALQGVPTVSGPTTTVRTVPESRVCPREMRFGCGDLVHTASIALGQFCFFIGDYYLFVETGAVTLE